MITARKRPSSRSMINTSTPGLTGLLLRGP
ncbi:hypothetical protein BKA15_002516 [Microlunatus parietis]|uniref:Uncharacterized protein n=1 Tax=Microlunatus parietis TaxID=682979 RepID=A0A7Y9I6S8_9ACTN|nr:hypothetical protein [Microlunatus parietis]